MLAGLLIACVPNREGALLPELVRAESLMYAHPDSALLILESMPVPSASDKLQQATYCLLLVQAWDKNYLKHLSDSLINIASGYFMKQNDPYRKALVLNYQGRVNEDSGGVEKATSFYLQARDMASGTDDYKLRFLIASNLGRICLYRNLSQEAKRFYEEANESALKANDPRYISASYSYLGRAFIMINNSDSSIISYKKAIEIAEQSNSSDNLKRALRELAAAYEEAAMYDSAIVHLKRVEMMEKESGSGGLYQTYLGLGGAYSGLGNFDSAIFYLNKSLLSTNIYTKRAIYKNLSELYEKHGDYKDVIAYNKLFLQAHDSIQQMEQSASIVEIHAEYDHEKLQNEKSQLGIERDRAIILSLCALLFFIIAIACILNIYHRKLLQRERALQKNKEKQERYLMQLHANECKISENEEQIQALSEQLQENSGMLEEQTVEINKICRENEKLHDENGVLQKEIAKYVLPVKSINDLPTAYLLLLEKYKQLCLREQFLSAEIVRRIPLLRQIQEMPKYLTEQQKVELGQEVDLLYTEFTSRLQKQFPALTPDDIYLCCLIKLRLSNATIAILIGVSPSSVTKHKQRMKEQMNQYLDKDLAKNRSFDTWLQEY